MTDVPARSHDRAPHDLRPTTIAPHFVKPAAGSALITQGETRVICTASVQESVPRWMAGQGRGSVTAEYGMLPASTGDRKARDISKGQLDGRTAEIQRLIGRSIRGVSISRRSASGRSTSTATSSPPTAARAARRSPAPRSRSTSRSVG